MEYSTQGGGWNGHTRYISSLGAELTAQCPVNFCQDRGTKRQLGSQKNTYPKFPGVSLRNPYCAGLLKYSYSGGGRAVGVRWACGGAMPRWWMMVEKLRA
jgi:hypothetical protein